MGKNTNHYGEKGHAMVGLLVMFLFITALILFNSPNLSLTNKVAASSDSGGALLGGGGGGIYDSRPGATSVTIPGEAVSGAALEDALAVLVRIAGTPVSILAGGGRAGLTAEVANTVGAISTLANTGQLTPNKNVALAAVKQVLLGLIQHTIKIVQGRIAGILATTTPQPTSVSTELLRRGAIKTIQENIITIPAAAIIIKQNIIKAIKTETSAVSASST